MIQLRGGPADDTTLMLRRAPKWLRVVMDPEGGIDGLDQLDDQPVDDEEVHVYVTAGSAGGAFLDFSGRGKPPSGYYPDAVYRHVPLPAAERAQLRLADDWRAWVGVREHVVIGEDGRALGHPPAGTAVSGIVPSDHEQE